MSERKKKHRKHHTLKQYFTVPVTFVLISLLAAIPVSLVMLHFSVEAVHKAQNTFRPRIADYSVSDTNYVPSDVKDGEVDRPYLYGFGRIGELSCKSAGLETAVYYGRNRASYRQGAGMSTDNAIPGEGGTVEISANSTGGFKALYNVNSGDVITLVTFWGTYKYKVFDIRTGTEYPSIQQETLHITTAVNKTAFSVYNNEKFIVSARLVSGPRVKGVSE